MSTLLYAEKLPTYIKVEIHIPFNNQRIRSPKFVAIYFCLLSVLGTKSSIPTFK